MGTCEEDMNNQDSLIQHFTDTLTIKSNAADNLRLPLRPHAEDCLWYIRSGICKFGLSCKFNHPTKRPKNQVWLDKSKDVDSEASVEQQETKQKTDCCRYYLTAGGCKYGQSCRFSHSKVYTVAAAPELNFLGLPVRLGEKECPFYMRNGSCGYGVSCRFNHPDPTTYGGSELHNQNLNDLSAEVYNHYQGKWNANVVPQVVHQNHEYDGYQVPNYFQETLQVEGFPQRPGQPNCEHFMSTGVCKFKSACWYHHPKSDSSLTILLSDKGLPLRPGRKICWHYEKSGFCKYGAGCIFDHPVNLDSSTFADE